MRVARYDVGDIKGTAEITKEGYIRADAVVSRTGVFSYVRPDGVIVRELRHPDDVFSAKSMTTLKMVPVTNEHPPVKIVGADTARQYQVGSTGESVHPDGAYLMTTICITDAATVSMVQAGKKELSCGYTCDHIEIPGEYNGEKYDLRQVDIEYNHVAICSTARAGHIARINLDSVDAVQHSSESETTAMSKIKLDNGIEYEAAPEVVAEIGSMRVMLDSAEKEGLEAKAKIKELQEKLDSISARDVDKEVNTRVAILRKAGEILAGSEVCAKLDSMDNTAVMSAVILHVNKDAKLDSASDEYLRARYDAAIDQVARDAEAKNRKAVTDSTGGQTEPSAQKSRENYLLRLTSGKGV